MVGAPTPQLDMNGPKSNQHTFQNMEPVVHTFQNMEPVVYRNSIN